MNQVDRVHVMLTYPDAVSHNSFGTAWWIEGNYINISGYHSTEEQAWLSAAYKIDAANPDKFQGHMSMACREVAKWPAWKQNILSSAGKSTGQRREPVGGADVY